MRILSPVSSGNGACIVHQMLESHISDYQVVRYNPYLTLFPPTLYLAGRSLHADIIHTFPDYANYHYRKNIPMVLTLHGYVLDKDIRQYSSMLQSIHYQTDLLYNTKKALSLAKIITAVSNFTADIVAKELEPKLEIRTIYNGVDESLFVPSGNQTRQSENKIKVLVSGHLSRKKGSLWIYEILTRLNHNISIYYTTGFRSGQQLPHHPQLHCLGSVPHNEMPAIYNYCDILLFPTVREGFGLVAAEAMACGLPVVASNCSSLPELIVDGKGGYLCTIGDVEDFANKINVLAENKNIRREMGEYNRARVEEKFTMIRMINEYEEVFEEAGS